MNCEFKDVIIVNEGEQFIGSVCIEDGFITKVTKSSSSICESDKDNLPFLLPGVIDDHVHMRDPGLTHKADMDTETRAAASGGVTTVLDMPNVSPQTTTLPLLEERYMIAAQKCHVNYGFFLGATNDNLQEISNVDVHRVPGVKLFMGSSTGNMLVDKEEALRGIFRQCPTLLMTHCEDTNRINQRMAEAKALYGNDPDVIHHPEIRDAEACYQSTALAVQLAKETGARLHVAHLTTARELDLFSPNDKQITAEACVAHLLFTDQDYATLGTHIKCNPAVKSKEDRQALRQALTDGRITVIGTDHAPHLLSEKEGGCCKAVSGMPMVQFSLPAMLSLVDEGVLSIERMVELMCHNPARLFGIERRGFIREGYHADLVLIRANSPWQVNKDIIQSRCGWSPLEGKTFRWRVERTYVNGQLVWDGEQIYPAVLGQAAKFNTLTRF
ncbi:MAG: dihydroorotase [Bacteroidaceae bacterium]|nr:dihydroorotase [Bacteroidaceae bacterium]